MGIEEIAKHKNQILALAAKHGASNVRIFGSVANGTANENSDVDFLVELQAGRSLFDMGLGIFNSNNDRILAFFHSILCRAYSSHMDKISIM